MPDLFWLSAHQFDRIKFYFPRPRGVPRVDDHRVVSGIIFVIKNGLRWRDAPREYGPHKTLYMRNSGWAYYPRTARASSREVDRPAHIESAGYLFP